MSNCFNNRLIVDSICGKEDLITTQSMNDCCSPQTVPCPEPNALLACENQTQPCDCGYNAWDFDPVLASASLETQSGYIYLARIDIHEPTEIRSIIVKRNAVFPVELLPAECFAGIYNEDRQLIAITSDFTDIAFNSDEMKLALTGPVEIRPQSVYVALLFNGTALPSLYGAPMNAASSLQTGIWRFAQVPGPNTILPSSMYPPLMEPSPVSLWVALR